MAGRFSVEIIIGGKILCRGLFVQPQAQPLAGCVTEALVAAAVEVVFDEESAQGDESRDFPIES